MQEDEILAWQKPSYLLCIWTENIHKLNKSEREQQLNELKLLKHLGDLNKVQWYFFTEINETETNFNNANF